MFTVSASSLTSQEPESPLVAPYSYATYDIPLGQSLDLPDGRSHIITRLVGSHPLWGHHLYVIVMRYAGVLMSNRWNTSRTLSSYLLENPSLVEGKRVLELGAGAGLPSIVCSLAGADRVVVTDYPDEKLVKNLAYNLDVNVPEDRRGVVTEAVSAAWMSGCVRQRVGLIEKGHVWGQDTKPLMSILEGPSSSGRTEDGGMCDLLLLSDLVFNHSQESFEFLYHPRIAFFMIQTHPPGRKLMEGLASRSHPDRQFPPGPYTPYRLLAHSMYPSLLHPPSTTPYRCRHGVLLSSSSLWNRMGIRESSRGVDGADV